MSAPSIRRECWIIKIIDSVFTLFLAALLIVQACAVASTGEVSKGEPVVMWHDAKSLIIEGRGWNDTASFYQRLPAKAKSMVVDDVWRNAECSSGMIVRFVTDSTTIKAKWTLMHKDLSMNHMAASGVSGVDLYIRFNGKWRWISTGRPDSLENEVVLDDQLPPGKHEFALDLPLYNGVEALHIGILDDATIEAAPPRIRNVKSVVFYGSSITMGGCVTRPGMVYSSIIGRKLDIPVINLGFNGSGRCEHEVADLLAELGPQVYVIDCLPNMLTSYAEERLRYLFKTLRQRHPDTPVVVVEQALYQNAYLEPDCPVISRIRAKDKILRKLFKEISPEWGSKLIFVPGSKLLGADGESTVDGVHPSDIGHARMAEVLAPAVEKAINESLNVHM